MTGPSLLDPVWFKLLISGPDFPTSVQVSLDGRHPTTIQVLILVNPDYLENYKVSFYPNTIICFEIIKILWIYLTSLYSDFLLF